MTNPTARTWAQIDLSALEHNYRVIGDALRPSRMMCVVKADAYGHGAVTVTHRLSKIGADNFGVATAEEAMELRGAGIAGKILVLDPTPSEYIAELAGEDIVLSAVDFDSAASYSAAAANSGKTIKVHLKLDSGMGRLGFQSKEEIVRALSLPNLEFEGIFTHFAFSDEINGKEFTKKQYHRFESDVKYAEKALGKVFPVKHCSASAAAFAYPQFRLDIARIGLSLYGVQADSFTLTPQLRPVMALKTRVVQIKELRPGDCVSYGCTWTSSKHGRAAVLPIGYADGLPRSLSNKLSVALNGKTAPQIGRICMDMCVIDISEIPDVNVGDVVTVFGGEDSPGVREAAHLAGTIPNELLCAVSQRVPRVNIG